ncbi:MAG: pilus assembly protein TadG-related protein [Bdellovibrionales bacterium]
MMTSFKMRLAKKLRLFAKSEAGMTLPVLALSFLTLTAFTGIAIDVGRVQMVQSKLQFSVDAAGLAAGATVNTVNADTEFKKYLDTNFDNYMGATITGYTVTPNNNNTVFTLTATASVPTTFMGVVGTKVVSLTAHAEISREITGLELVLALDNTGSMSESSGGSVTKLQALKTASNTLIDTLFGGSTVSTNGKLYVGIVPFSQGVNIGTSRSTWITNYNASVNSSWGGCLDARQNGYDVTDDTPSAGSPYSMFNMRSYVKRIEYLSSGAEISTTTVSSCTPSSNYYQNKKTICTATGNYYYASPLEHNTSWSSDYSGPTYGQNTTCAQQLTPMTNDSSTLETAVNAMAANGSTIINEGMVWAWRMLSPKWRGLWGGTMGSTLPLDYGTKGMAKAVVLLTDGLNTMYDSIQAAYWFPRNNWTGSTSISGSEDALDAKTLSICTAMKEQGIIIYTIGLGPSSGINETLLRNCATAENYYFHSPTTSELQSVFNTIGDSLSNLRVSQ